MTSSNVSPSELYAIQLQNEEPGYFAQIPAILGYCTYIEEINGKPAFRRKLKPISIALYLTIKQIAGQNGACWCSRDELAKRVNCSAGAISNAKKELCMPMEQLNGKSLITIQKKKKKHSSGSGATTYHLITVSLIWGENNAYMATKKYQDEPVIGEIKNNICDSDENVHKCSTLSCGDNVNSTLSSDDNVDRVTLSWGDTNNRNNRKNHSVSTEESAAGAAPVCSSEGAHSVISENAQKLEHAVKEMRKFGCDENFIREMTRRFTPQQIIDGGVYTSKQLKRKKIANRFGYLRDAIEKGRKWDGG